MPSLPLTLAFAHLRRRKTQNLISLIGVAIGVAVLTTALSLTNGFVQALIEATVKAQPHLDLQSWGGPVGAVRDPVLEARLSATKTVTSFSSYVRAAALLSRRARNGAGGAVGYAQIYGVQPDREARTLRLSPAESQLLATLPPRGVLLGQELASSIGVVVKDEVLLTTAQGSNVFDARRSALTVVGTFRTGNYLIDNGVAFTRQEPLQQALDLNGKIHGYHVRLSNPNDARTLGPQLTRGTPFFARPWQDSNGSLISQLALQKLVISIVLMLLEVVAAFGIVNILVLTVFEKTQEIAILRAMGASARAILTAFLLEGAVLGILGVAAGNLLGFGLSAYFRWRPIQLPGDLYFITSLPVDIRATDFVWVSAASLAITLLAAWAPARRAAAIQPAKIIR